MYRVSLSKYALKYYSLSTVDGAIMPPRLSRSYEPIFRVSGSIPIYSRIFQVFAPYEIQNDDQRIVECYSLSMYGGMYMPLRVAVKLEAYGLAATQGLLDETIDLAGTSSDLLVYKAMLMQEQMSNQKVLDVVKDNGISHAFEYVNNLTYSFVDGRTLLRDYYLTGNRKLMTKILGATTSSSLRQLIDDCIRSLDEFRTYKIDD